MDILISKSILTAKILDDVVMKSGRQPDDLFQHLHSQDSLSLGIYHKELSNSRLMIKEKWQEHCKSQTTLPKSSDSSPPFLCYCLSLAAKNLLFASHLPHPIHTEKIMCPASYSTESWMSAHIFALNENNLPTQRRPLVSRAETILGWLVNSSAFWSRDFS